MKSLVVLFLFVAAVSAVPAGRSDYEDSDEGFFLFPMGKPHKKAVPSVVEVEVGSDSDEDASYFPSYFRPFFVNPFSFMNFGFSDFFSRPSWFDSLVPKDIPNASVKNSTSTSKVVDGHKIIINETIYENEKNGAVYKVQVIEVSPAESGEKETEKAPEESKGEEGQEKEKGVEPPVEVTEEVKPDQNSEDNEIQREEMLASYELQGDDPTAFSNHVEVIDLENRPRNLQSNVVDLSSDIRVNQLLAEDHKRGGLFMIPPEVEVFDKLDYDYVSGSYQHVLQPEFNFETPSAQINQEIVRPQYNQEVVRPQYNQGVIPTFNQGAATPQINQEIVKPQYNQGPLYNQQVISPYNQGAAIPQINQQVVKPQYNQGVIPEYNQRGATPRHNDQIIFPQNNQGVVVGNYNQQVLPPLYNQGPTGY